MGGKLSKNVGFLQKMRVSFLPLPGFFFPDSGKMTGKLHANKKNAEGIMLKTEKGRREKRKKKTGLSPCPPPCVKKSKKSLSRNGERNAYTGSQQKWGSQNCHQDFLRSFPEAGEEGEAPFPLRGGESGVIMMSV